MSCKFFPSDKFIVRRPFRDYGNHMFTIDEFNSIVKQEYFQEALYYASPDLYDELKKYLSATLPEKDIERMVATLYKYVQRINYRATPFGSFAYCSIGQFSDDTYVPKNNSVRKHYRYDCRFLYDYVSYLLKNADYRLIESLNLSANQTLVSIKSFYHLTVQGLNGQMVDIKLQRNELLDFVINYSKNNVSCSKLILEVIDKFEISRLDLVKYIKNLILMGVLIPDVKIATTGKDNFYKVYQILKNSNVDLLDDLYHTITVLNSDICFDEKRKEIDSLIKKAHSFGLEVKRNMFIQVDSFSDEHVFISEPVKKQITEWYSILTHICAPLDNPLRDFISRYTTRYENMSNSVLEVLNSYVGIGYQKNSVKPSDLISQLFSIGGKRNVKTKIYSYNLSEIEQIVLSKILANGDIKGNLLTLAKSDFPDQDYFGDNDYSLSYSCMYKIVGYNEKGPIISNMTFSGPSASCLITRFDDGLDEISDILKEISESENHAKPDVILAEISHLSNPHAGNVQIRPSFRQFEIPYLSFSDEGKTQSIHIDDLKIRIVNGRVNLQSKKYSQEVLPCYSSAFNYKRNTSELYQFLGDVQQQNAARGLTANFKTLLGMLKHIPRICYENIIVNPESWMIDNFWKNSHTCVQLERFRKLHQSLKMSRYLSFSQGDNYFIIDIESEISVLEFFKLSKNQENVVLSEFLFLSDDFRHFDSILEIVQPFLPNKE